MDPAGESIHIQLYNPKHSLLSVQLSHLGRKIIHDLPV